jgi:hypothetical protein
MPRLCCRELAGENVALVQPLQQRVLQCVHEPRA